MIEDKDVICVILLLLLFYVIFHKKTIEVFSQNKLVGQVERNWNPNPPLGYS